MQRVTPEAMGRMFLGSGRRRGFIHSLTQYTGNLSLSGCTVRSQEEMTDVTSIRGRTS